MLYYKYNKEQRGRYTMNKKEILEARPIATLAVFPYNIYLTGVRNGIDDSVEFVDVSNHTAHVAKIYYNINGGCYFKYKGKKYYTRDFLRAD